MKLLSQLQILSNASEVSVRPKEDTDPKDRKDGEETVTTERGQGNGDSKQELRAS